MKIGYSPRHIETTFCDTGLQEVFGANRTLNSYSGNIILLSFINRKRSVLGAATPGYWSWLSNLENIRTTIESFITAEGLPTGFQALAVVSDFGSEGNLSGDLPALGYPVLMDAGGIAATYRSEFLNNPGDDSFNGTTLDTGIPNHVSDEIWSFIICEQFIVTDKWHREGTNMGPTGVLKDPISFYHLENDLSPLTFDSTDLANTEAFSAERIRNLLLAPRILAVDPVDGATVNLSVSSPSFPVNITFSKPVGEVVPDAGHANDPMWDTTIVTNPSNYPLGDGGGTDIEVSQIIYGNTASQVGAIENAVTLTVENTTALGTLHPGTVLLDVNNNPTTADRIKDLSGIELPILTNTEAITYNGPEILSFSLDPSAAINTASFSNPLNITVTYTDPMCQNGAPAVPLNPNDFSLSGTDDYGSLADTDLTVPTIVVSNSYQLSIDMTGLSGTGRFRIDFGALQTDIYGNSLVGSNFIEYTLDTTGPTLISATLASDNSTIALQFSEPVYTDADGTGALVLTDFDFTFNQNGGAATINTTTGFLINHSEGDDIVLIELVITNTPCGVERLTVTPKANEIYDSAGNPLIAVSALEFTLGDTRSPADLVLVLDYSGSMDSVVSFDGSSKSKKEWVKDAVDYFLNLMDDSDYVDNLDQIGMVLYANNAIDARTLQHFTDVTDRNHYLDGLDDTPTPDLTAMGSGLARALNMVNYSQSNNAYSRKRSIILLADGQQNRGPEIEITGTGYQIAAPGGGIDTGWPPIGDIVVNRGDPAFFPIHTIGIGYHSSWLSRLQNIAGATNGVHHADNEVWPLADASFTTFLTALYPNNSPQLVRNNIESFTSGESNNHSFELNSSVNQLIIGITWAAPYPLKFTLEKGSTRIVFDKVIENNESQFYIGIVSFPHCQHQQPLLHLHAYGKSTVRRARFESRASVVRSGLMFNSNGSNIPAESVKPEGKDCIDPEGSWNVLIDLKHPGQSPSQMINYHLTIIADEKKLACHVVKPGHFQWAGDRIDLGYWLTADGKIPDIPHSAHIQVSSPRINMGKLLSRLPVGNPDLHVKASADAQTSPVFLKLELIQKLRKRMAVLQRKRKTSLLLSSAIVRGSKKKIATTGGARGAFFTGTRIPGTYRVDFRIKSEGKQGIYERVHSEHYFINVKPDRARTKIRAQYNRKYKSYIVTVTPKDRFRNYLGPGYKDQIQCTLVDKKNRVQIGDIIDNLNGSYQIGFKEISKAELKSKNLHIQVMKRYVFNNKLSKIRKIFFLCRIFRALCNRICHSMR